MAALRLPRTVSLPIAALVLTGGVAAGVTGCSTTTKVEVTKTSLANTIKSKLAASDGTSVDQVKCKGPLEGKVGATQVCAAKLNGQWYTVNVTTTSIDGKEVNFNYKPDPQPTSAPSY